MQFSWTTVLLACLIWITCGSVRIVKIAACLEPSFALKKYFLKKLSCGTWQSLQVVHRLWLLCDQEAYWGYMTWQLMQVSGLSDRYDGAFDSYKTNATSPMKIAVIIFTINLHFSGGIKRRMIFLRIFFKLLLNYLKCIHKKGWKQSYININQFSHKRDKNSKMFYRRKI